MSTPVKVINPEKTGKPTGNEGGGRVARLATMFSQKAGNSGTMVPSKITLPERNNPLTYELHNEFVIGNEGGMKPGRVNTTGRRKTLRSSGPGGVVVNRSPLRAGVNPNYNASTRNHIYNAIYNAPKAVGSEPLYNSLKTTIGELIQSPDFQTFAKGQLNNVSKQRSSRALVPTKIVSYLQQKEFGNIKRENVQQIFNTLKQQKLPGYYKYRKFIPGTKKKSNELNTNAINKAIREKNAIREKIARQRIGTVWARPPSTIYNPYNPYDAFEEPDYELVE